MGLNGGGTVRARSSVASSTRVRSAGNAVVFDSANAHKTADIVLPVDSELLLRVERRLRALEVSVGTDAPCVRNIASPKKRQCCGHRIAQAKLHYTACGWQHNSAAHVRLASKDANRLPESQLCEICWHAGNSDTNVAV